MPTVQGFLRISEGGESGGKDDQFFRKSPFPAFPGGRFAKMRNSPEEETRNEAVREGVEKEKEAGIFENRFWEGGRKRICEVLLLRFSLTIKAFFPSIRCAERIWRRKLPRFSKIPLPLSPLSLPTREKAPLQERENWGIIASNFRKDVLFDISIDRSRD